MEPSDESANSAEIQAISELKDDSIDSAIEEKCDTKRNSEECGDTNPSVQQSKPSELSDKVIENVDDDLEIEKEIDETQIPEEMTGKDRNETFQKAESYFGKSKLDLALQYYLQCVKGIERGSGFLYLPQCLHQIAECYHLKDEDEKAIQFLKAEKIYYETALIDTQKMQEKIEEIVGSDEEKVSEELESEILRAVEYENLAKLCLEKHQTQLALEFSGKATKLYQHHYGDDHEATQRCLDLFTSVYAEVGREEYTSKLSEYGVGSTESEDIPTSEGKAKSELRNRRAGSKRGEVTHTATQSSPSSLVEDDADERSCCYTAFLWTILLVSGIAAAFLFSIVYCKLTPTSWTCHWSRVQYRYFSNQLEYVFYKLQNKS